MAKENFNFFPIIKFVVVNGGSQMLFLERFSAGDSSCLTLTIFYLSLFDRVGNATLTHSQLWGKTDTGRNFLRFKTLFVSLSETGFF